MTYAALRVPKTDAASRTTHRHLEVAAPAGPVATAAPLLEENQRSLHLIEARKKLRLKMIAKLFVVSIVILTGSPALATRIAHPDVHCLSCEQKADGCRYRTFGACVAPESDTPRWKGRAVTHDNWPAGMILG
jgi:hypothetical protein